MDGNDTICNMEACDSEDVLCMGKRYHSDELKKYGDMAD